MDKKTDIVETPFIQDLINRTTTYVEGGFPVHFTGPTGIGKTTLALAVARKLQRPFKIIRGNQEMSNYDLIGGATGVIKRSMEDNYIHSVYKTEVKTSPMLVSGQLMEAVRYGNTLVYDEFNRSTPEVNNIFLSVLEEKVLPMYGLYGISQRESYISVHPDFRILFISNPREYAGVHSLQEALLDRMITIDLESIDFETYVQIVAQKSNVSLKAARSVSDLIHRVLVQVADIQYPSLRAGIMIATIVKSSGIKMFHADERFDTLVYEVLSRYVEREDRQVLKTIMIQEMHHMNSLT